MQKDACNMATLMQMAHYANLDSMVLLEASIGYRTEVMAEKDGQ